MPINIMIDGIEHDIYDFFESNKHLIAVDVNFGTVKARFYRARLKMKKETGSINFSRAKAIELLTSDVNVITAEAKPKKFRSVLKDAIKTDKGIKIYWMPEFLWSPGK